MKRLIHGAAVLLLSLTLGLHWVALQSVAWTTMLIERAQAAPFAVALQSTFDGQHPCKLCRVVEAGRATEKAPTAPLKLPKLEIVSLTAVGFEVVPPCLRQAPFPEPSASNSRADRPPVPPPRWA